MQPTKTLRHSRWAALAVVAAGALLAGCDVSGGHLAGTAPGSSTSSTPTAVASTPTAVASTATSTSGKPSIGKLETALADYFGLQPELTGNQSRRAAACAAYPTFQELSGAGLDKVIKGNESDLTGTDATGFQHVVTECTKAAGGPGD